MKQEIKIEPRLKQEECKHENFGCWADVNRITREGGAPDEIACYLLDLKVYCTDCAMPLEFVGLPVGVSFYRPACSLDGQEARIPMVEVGKAVPAGMAGYGMTMQSFEPAAVVKQ